MLEHWNAVEADFQREYGLDLPHLVWVEQASARRVTALVLGLSPTGALLRAVRPEDWMWTSEHELLAVNAELNDMIYRLLFKAHTKESAKQPTPIEIPRPGVERKRKGTTLSELMAMRPPIKKG